MNPIHPAILQRVLEAAVLELPDPLEWDEDYIIVPIFPQQSSGSPITKEPDSAISSNKKAFMVEFKKVHEDEKMERWEYVKIKEF